MCKMHLWLLFLAGMRTNREKNCLLVSTGVKIHTSTPVAQVFPYSKERHWCILRERGREREMEGDGGRERDCDRLMVCENLWRCHFTPLLAWPGHISQCRRSEEQSQLPSLSSKTTDFLHTLWIPPPSHCITAAYGSSGVLIRTSLAYLRQRPSPLFPLWTPACLLPTSSCQSPLLRRRPGHSSPHRALCQDEDGGQANPLGSEANSEKAPVKRRS